MLSLSVDLAIFQRLTGAPLDNQGRPVLDASGVPVNRSLINPPSLGGTGPSYGIRIPVAKDPRQVFDLKTSSPGTMQLFDRGFYRDQYRQVPVFWEGTGGRDWEDIWPCVVFSQTGESNPDHYIYYDDIEAWDPSTPEYIDEEGNEGRGGIFTSPHPEQSIFNYAIKVYAKNRVELSLIEDQVKRLFPQKGAIVVDRADGSQAAFDMIRYLIDDLSPRPGDKARALLGDQRFYGKAFSYRIEAYADHTVRGFGDQFSQQREVTILGRVQELVDTQNALAVQSGEIQDVTLKP